LADRNREKSGAIERIDGAAPEVVPRPAAEDRCRLEIDPLVRP
jgi:hypothetical protein